ncbi:hypothetical protein EVAR_63011_1 [Eumeta japonica]|uniref:Uncharacterized protein n=1 Tax=Eumeta variegata TaxID=151549 RepID=A0A4C1YWH9_EUMVA|nr:hypothetical protein EVAR_63011_1 [Eumeta japonica]
MAPPCAFGVRKVACLGRDPFWLEGFVEFRLYLEENSRPETNFYSRYFPVDSCVFVSCFDVSHKSPLNETVLNEPISEIAARGRVTAAPCRSDECRKCS